MINKVFYLINKKKHLSIYLFILFNLDQNLLKTDPTNLNDMVDIDERLKSLEKFMKENLPS